MLNLIKFIGKNFDRDDRCLISHIPTMTFSQKTVPITMGSCHVPIMQHGRLQGNIKLYNLKPSILKKVAANTDLFNIEIYKDINEYDENLDLSYAMRCVYKTPDPDHTMIDCYSNNIKLLNEFNHYSDEEITATELYVIFNDYKVAEYHNGKVK